MALLKSPFLQTISPDMRGLLSSLSKQEFLQRFYLAGGTALALQLGHRHSVDLDFFSERDEVHELTRQEIISIANKRGGQVIENVDGNLILLMDGIHVGFFSYGYPLLEPTLEFDNVRLASLLDIGLMKLDALMGRGSRKDFYDLYFICQQLPMADILAAGERKYSMMRDFALMSVESFLQFEVADRDFQPEMLVDLSWDSVRQFFISQARGLGKRWFFSG